MEIQKEKIMRFSKVVYVFMKIAFILLIVLGSLQLLTWIWSSLNLHTEIISISGINLEAPLLFKSGDFKVYLPIMWESGFDLMADRSVALVSFSEIMLTVLSIVGVGCAKSVFKLLRENGSPFREDVVKSLKKLAVALLCMGVVGGVVPFVAAGIVWVLRLIFDYGNTLQSESDTTL